MPNPLIIKNRYTPKVGEGVPMLAALREASDEWEKAGFPRLELWAPHDGPHNGLVTIQRWASYADWEAVRTTIPTITALRAVVFDRVYPTNATAYETELYDEISAK